MQSRNIVGWQTRPATIYSFKFFLSRWIVRRGDRVYSIYTHIVSLLDDRDEIRRVGLQGNHTTKRCDLVRQVLQLHHHYIIITLAECT